MSSRRSKKDCGKKDESSIFGVAFSLRQVECRKRLPKVYVEALHEDL